jgi:hypothetical protein
MAASAAATVKISSAKICPVRSPEKPRKRHEIDVDGEQDQFDRHQDDDDVLAVREMPNTPSVNTIAATAR